MPMEVSTDPVLDEPQIMHVRVINRNDFKISDMFDGVPYVFPSNQPLSIPVDAAHHIFGWHENADSAALKKHVQKRFGWNTPLMEQDGRADRFYAALEIKPILYRMVPVELDEDDPAVVAKRAPKVNKLMAAAGEALRT